MPSETIKCPCCGQLARPTGAFRVDLNENLLYFRDKSLPLVPQLTELAFILARRMPATVLHETLISAVWGAAPLEDALNSLKVAIPKLRTAIAPLGLAVINTKSRGYRMEIMAAKSRTERTPLRPFHRRATITTLEEVFNDAHA